MVRESLAARKEVIFESETTRLTGLMDYIHDNISLNSQQHKKKKLSWAFDGKRKLDREINVFAENTFTTPYDTVEEAFRRQYGIGEKVGRPRGTVLLTQSEIDEIKAASSKITHKQLADKYGVSVSTIKRVRG
jgi:ribosomal protein S25